MATPLKDLLSTAALVSSFGNLSNATTQATDSLKIMGMYLKNGFGPLDNFQTPNKQAYLTNLLASVVFKRGGSAFITWEDSIKYKLTLTDMENILNSGLVQKWKDESGWTEKDGQQAYEMLVEKDIPTMTLMLKAKLKNDHPGKEAWLLVGGPKHGEIVWLETGRTYFQVAELKQPAWKFPDSPSKEMHGVHTYSRELYQLAYRRYAVAFVDDDHRKNMTMNELEQYIEEVNLPPLP